MKQQSFLTNRKKTDSEYDASEANARYVWTDREKRHEHCGADITDRPHASSIILRDSRNRVLIIKRDHADNILFPGRWCLVGGRVEFGETFDQAILRECWEETGIRPQKVNAFLTYETIYHVERVFWSPEIISEEQVELGEGERFTFATRREIAQRTFGFSADRIIHLFFDGGFSCARHGNVSDSESTGHAGRKLR